MYQHAVDIGEVRKDINRLDKDIKQLKKKQGTFTSYILVISKRVMVAACKGSIDLSITA